MIMPCMAMVVDTAATSELPSNVEMNISGVKNLHLDEIEDETQYSYNKHKITLDLRWFEETISSLNY
jgi:hypothetical protein